MSVRLANKTVHLLDFETDSLFFSFFTPRDAVWKKGKLELQLREGVFYPSLLNTDENTARLVRKRKVHQRKKKHQQRIFTKYTHKKLQRRTKYSATQGLQFSSLWVDVVKERSVQVGRINRGF